MADVTIKKKPDRKATSLGTPVREKNGSHRMTAKWAVPSRLTDGNCDARCNGWEVRWQVKCYHHTKKKWKTLTWSHRYGDPRLKEHTLNLSSFKCTDGKTYTRSSFFPHTGWLLMSATINVRPYNNKGDGEWVKATRSFEKPRKPSISISQDAETGHIVYTVRHNKGEDYYENENTRVRVVVFDSRNGKTAVRHDGTFPASSESYSNAVDIQSRMQLTVKQYVTVRVDATCRGYRGSSSTVTKRYYVSWPATPTIGRIDCGGARSTSKVTANVSTNYNPYKNVNKVHPVTGIRLETLVDTDYKKASEIPASANWQSTDVVDDGQCTALSTMAADLFPSAGKTSWIRVKAWNDIESLFYLYSAPKRVTGLETPAATAADDSVKILEQESGDDGESAVLLLAWSNDDSTGTHLEWSDDQYAWRSTEGPKSHDFTWSDGSIVHDGVTYAKSARIHVPGLQQGTKYYFKACRYLENDDGTEYGKWSKTVAVTPHGAPPTATISTVTSVPRGSSLPLSWTHDTSDKQRRWAIITGATTTTTDLSGATHTWIDESQPIKVVSRGTGEIGSTTIDGARLAELTDGTDSIQLAVRVSTGSETITSEAVNVYVADAPTLAMTISGTLTAQHLSFDLQCSTAAGIVVVVTACGAEHDHPDGSRMQPAGDTAWSAALTPTWTAVVEDDEVVGYTTTVDAPDELPLYNKGCYDVLVRAVDERTGLSSNDATGSFVVDYARAASTPSDEITVTPYDVTDSDGVRSMGATIQLAAATGMDPTDVYDIYRLTQDGATLIASDRGATDEVVDPYAPFGDDVTLAYRISCRTTDGMEEWRDYEYELPCALTRIDWDGGYLELPFNLRLTESWEKDFEARRHLDGSIDGYWNRGTQRTATISTDFRKMWDEEATMAMRELANHCGPCLVRTHTGLCFMANVQPSNHEWSYNSSVLSTSFSMTEIALTDEFMASVPEVEEGS